MVTELLKNNEIKDKYESIVNKCEIYKENNIIELKLFEVLRHIVLHFPFFHTWDEIYLKKNIKLEFRM